MNAQTLTKIEGLDVQEPEFIDVDMPFNAKEVEKATSKRYVEQLTRSDMPIVAAQYIPAEAYRLRAHQSFIMADKKRSRAAVPTEYVFDPIDVDMPFSAAEVAALTSEAYVAALGPSDMPIVGRWGQFVPSACKVSVVDNESIAADRIRRIASKSGIPIEDSFTYTDALA